MKKIILLFVIFWGVFNLYGQEIKYKMIKDKYHITDYSPKMEDQKYSPVAAGILSYLLPGGGHYYLNEGERGILFTTTYLIGAGILVKGVVNYIFGQGYGEETIYLGLFMAGGSMLWSIIDAVKIAKIKNLAYQDLEKNNTSILLQPVLINVKNDKMLGVSIAINF